MDHKAIDEVIAWAPLIGLGVIALIIAIGAALMGLMSVPV